MNKAFVRSAQNPELWYSYYDHSYLEEVEISGAQTRPDQKSSKPQNTSSPVGREDLKAFKERIGEMLKDKKCADFIRELLEEAKRQTGKPYSDILTTFDQINFFWAAGQSRAFYLSRSSSQHQQ